MKKEYVSPEVEDLGSLHELTQGLSILVLNLDGEGGGSGGHSFS
ncbi:lasso RiPP family leader peptide-containing protein [Pseudonocardia sp. Cha107L01]